MEIGRKFIVYAKSFRENSASVSMEVFIKKMHIIAQVGSITKKLTPFFCYYEKNNTYQHHLNDRSYLRNMVMSSAKTFAFKTSCLTLAGLGLVSIANGEIISNFNDNDSKVAQSFELHHHARALERTKGFGEFLDDFLANQGIGRQLHPREGQTKKKPNAKPRNNAPAKPEKKLKTVARTPNGGMLKECIQEVLNFKENKRGSEEKDIESPTDSPTDSPTIKKKNKGRRRQGRKLENGDWDKDPADHFDDEYEEYDEYDDDELKDNEYQLPSWLSGHTFDEMNRRLASCSLPTERSNDVSLKIEFRDLQPMAERWSCVSTDFSRTGHACADAVVFWLNLRSIQLIGSNCLPHTKNPLTMR